MRNLIVFLFFSFLPHNFGTSPSYVRSFVVVGLCRKELKEYKDWIDRQMEEKESIEKFRKLEDEAKRNHFLISTKQIPGVYNSPYQP